MLHHVEQSSNVAIPAPALPSKNQLKNAGDRIRKRVTGALELDGEQAALDVRLVDIWRTAHSATLSKTRVGLGAVVMRELGLGSQAGLVSQRLKRIESIVTKLVRAKTRLGEMEDIAGCRAVLPNQEIVLNVHARLAERARKLEVLKVRDYNAEPHQGGYRALHLWCRRDDFKVEIQLRTFRQHRWAELVEEWDNALGLDLKHEIGPDVVLEYFRELATYYSSLDRGMAESEADLSALGQAQDAVEAWMRGG